MEEITVTGEISTETTEEITEGSQTVESLDTEDRENITVIDSVMGKGKTQFLIQYMNENHEKAFIYCTPFLDEIERIRGRWNDKTGGWAVKPACPRLHFSEPTFYNGRKIDDFNKLLFESRNITVTHATFANATEETIQNIKEGGYTLILDETLNTLVDFNDICTGQKLRKGDIDLLIGHGFISVDSFGVVSWLDKTYKDNRYSDVERMAKNGTLLLINGTLLYWEFPYTIFKYFKEVYIATYLFEGSIMCSYLKSHNISWTKKSVCCDGETEDGKKHYSLTDYTPDIETIRTFKNLITIFQNEKMNDYTGSSLSKTWFQKYANNIEMDRLKNNLYNFFKNHMKAKPQYILWTVPVDYMPRLKGRGYIQARSLTDAEKKLPKAEKDRAKAHASCFLACNSRATNLFSDRKILAYALNVYPQPHITDYLSQRNSPLDRNKYALSQMIQWIWRSCIRNGEPITIYIPSYRMRKLLNDWLNSGMPEDEEEFLTHKPY